MVLLAITTPPFITAEWFYLFAVNPVLGLIEGLLIAWVLRRPPVRLVCSMILANYVSAIMARSALLPPARLWMRVDMPWTDSLWGIGLLVAPVAALCLLTILVEWPFAILGIRTNRPGKWRIFLASTVAQLLTLPAIVFMLAAGSDASFVTATTLDDSLRSQVPAATEVYYITPQDASVRRITIRTGEDSTVSALPAGGPHSGKARLLLCPANEPGSYDLTFDPGADAGWNINPTLVAGGFRRASTTDGGCLTGAQFLFDGGDILVDYGAGTQAGLAFSTPAGPRKYAMSTPFARWYPDNLTVLPNNLLVFGMANHIWLLHPESGRIAVLATGTSPVVR